MNKKNKMKINLTKQQIEAIQKLLMAHSSSAGKIPNSDICFNAYKKIENQTRIIHITDLDLKRNKLELKKIMKK